MSTFHHTPRSKQPVPPVRHRSSSAARVGSSSYGSRPRSVGYYGANTNPYSGSNAYSSPYSNGSSYSSLNSYNPSYGSSYQSPYFPNGYRGASGAGGYASLTIPAKALSNVKTLTQNYPKSYENNYLKSDNGRRSRRDISRGSSYRERSASRSMGSLPGSGMGPRSMSLTSLNSEGYFSGSERSSRSRISSLADIRNENGEIDYKKLYEDQLVENERLKDKLRKTDEELRDTKQTLEKINVVTSKNSLSELEKRERRAIERKLSEMEEELKQLQKLKAENERLRADNRSLTRVINKLTNAAKQ
ncbi:hypothetical protein GWI33_013072 [Rhynchophorus ferrugineus]|uniref:cGMP-dependent protein kinase interacting domain-containing protein n=1 Tax=Rhynchophorus ferrugineus TaxID=354439 RepID=A0A834MBW8_RHYFE|nr:hypothetical protein GWI33_013072 [Rhynchophorus ferrugineus]